jgi:hypothetical protein
MPTGVYPRANLIYRQPYRKGRTVRIQLTQRQVAVIDAADLPLVAGYNWHAMRSRLGHTWYAATHDRRAYVLMHRVIMSAPKGLTVDHVDGDGLNNRRKNLRLARQGQQLMNKRMTTKSKTSRYKGVWWQKAHDRHRAGWNAGITINGKKYVKEVSSQKEGARIYDALARKHFGQFAKING